MAHDIDIKKNNTSKFPSLRKIKRWYSYIFIVIYSEFIFRWYYSAVRIWLLLTSNLIPGHFVDIFGQKLKLNFDHFFLLMIESSRLFSWFLFVLLSLPQVTRIAFSIKSIYSILYWFSSFCFALIFNNDDI